MCLQKLTGNRCAKDAAVKVNLYLAVHVGTYITGKIRLPSITLENTCPVTPIQKKNDIKTVEQLVRNNPNIKSSEIQSTFVLSAFQRGMDWDKVD